MAEAWPERDQKSVGAAGLGQMVCCLLTLPGYKSVFLKEIVLSISIYRVFKNEVLSTCSMYYWASYPLINKYSEEFINRQEIVSNGKSVQYKRNKYYE